MKASMRADAKDKKLFNPTESSDVLSYVREKADFFIELPEYEGCRILGLSTCSDGASTDRIIVFAYILE